MFGVIFLSVFLVIIGLIITIVADYFLQEMKKDEEESYYYNSSYFVYTRNELDKVKNNANLIGEYNSFNALRQYEECGGKFLFNVYLPREDGTIAKSDMLFLTPKGIFVINSKNLYGHVSGGKEDFEWNQFINKDIVIPFDNPIVKNADYIECLKKCIGEDCPVYSVVVFSDTCKIVDVPYDLKDTYVINNSFLKQLVSAVCVNNQSVISNKDIDSIQKALFPYTRFCVAE